MELTAEDVGKLEAMVAACNINAAAALLRTGAAAELALGRVSVLQALL